MVIHCLSTFQQELNAVSNYSCLQAFNDTFIIKLCPFGCRLCVCCFIIHLSLYVSYCTICVCNRSVGGQRVRVPS